MTKIPYKTAYSPHNRHQLDFPHPSFAKQSFRDECNINNIMKQFEKTGLIAHQRLTGGSYDDFIGSPEYHDAMNQILDAQASFEALPAKIRARFGNDPAAFLDFAQILIILMNLSEWALLLPFLLILQRTFLCLWSLIPSSLNLTLSCRPLLGP